jgi:hypothetical protein
MYNTMVDAGNLYLEFSSMAITNESLELGI